MDKLYISTNKGIQDCDKEFFNCAILDENLIKMNFKDSKEFEVVEKGKDSELTNEQRFNFYVSQILDANKINKFILLNKSCFINLEGVEDMYLDPFITTFGTKYALKVEFKNEVEITLKPKRNPKKYIEAIKKLKNLNKEEVEELTK